MTRADSPRDHDSSSAFDSFEFPRLGWRQDRSSTTGKDMLYRGRERVLVRKFSGTAQFEAYGTHWFLKEAGVRSAEIAKVSETDGQDYYYVFADLSEALTLLDPSLFELMSE